ncbi:MAG: NADPH-dependent glutamate synthase [Oscillospiraceae bacterium]|jgi:glutamate synthase (NADPH/NADH) small chain|nr:NADPH-dependent glutamate synthase [Oscillospiraceae bacterium]
MAGKNMSLEKTPMPEQEPGVRSRNFDEVALGYTDGQAMAEAARCLGCKSSPCVAGCPVNVRIPEFIARVADGDFPAAAEIVTSSNALPAICGRVCPQEKQCESLCVRGKKGESVAIGRLERFVADKLLDAAADGAAAPAAGGTAPIGRGADRPRVAVVGAGPSGLTCAGELAKLGYAVTVFEALHTPGGVLVYGIPEFRLPKAIVRREIANLTSLGVEIITNVVVGRTIPLDELLGTAGYSAAYIASGAGLPKFQHIPGENLNGVYSANEFLTRINLMRAYEFPQYDTPLRVGDTVAVVGGGNVAMDAARCAKRVGAKNVYIVYRRGEAELPARLEEIHHAREEGVVFKFLTAPTRLEGDGDGFVRSMECQEMELGEPDASGRRRPVIKPGGVFTLDVSTVVVAIGNTPNPLIVSTTPGLAAESWGGVIADEETGATNRPGVYAGGDAVTGAATVILAMGAGKKAAAAIDVYLTQKG